MLDIAIVTDEIALDIRTAIAEGLKLGVRKYELRCIGSYDKRVPFVDPEDYRYVLDLVQKGAIEITALSPGIFKVRPSDQAAVQSVFEQTLPKTMIMAKELRAPVIISFGFLRDDSKEEAVVDLLRKTADLVNPMGLVVAVENEPGFFCDSGQTTARLLAVANRANLGANWDPANAIGTGEIPFPVGYEALKHFIRNVHVKDAIIDARQGCKLLGEGGVNWAGQIAALQRDALVAHVTLETHCTPLLESTQFCHRRLLALMAMAKEWNA
ncbi:MAG TPA: TIM barrel protein [bacterium]|nr:TIM barrel protein [bacterium]